jgi:hypothetical protein
VVEVAVSNTPVAANAIIGRARLAATVRIIKGMEKSHIGLFPNHSMFACFDLLQIIFIKSMPPET